MSSSMALHLYVKVGSLIRLGAPCFVYSRNPLSHPIDMVWLSRPHAFIWVLTSGRSSLFSSCFAYQAGSPAQIKLN